MEDNQVYKIKPRRCRTDYSVSAMPAEKIVYEEDVIDNKYCCPKCDAHFRIDPEKRIRMVADRDSFQEWDADLIGDNPLDFPGYEEKLESVRGKDGAEGSRGHRMRHHPRNEDGSGK